MFWEINLCAYKLELRYIFRGKLAVYGTPKEKGGAMSTRVSSGTVPIYISIDKYPKAYMFSALKGKGCTELDEDVVS